MELNGEESGAAAGLYSLFDVLYGFLMAQRLDLYPPEELAPGVTVLRADDDNHLVNCYVTYEPPPGTPTAGLQRLLEQARTDPARTELVIPDDRAALANELNQVAQGHVRKVHPLSECLDGFLRPGSICYELAGPSEGNERLGRRARQPGRQPMFESTLLNENDWVPQHAIVPDRGLEHAQSYLHQNWARGLSPRLCIVVAPAGHGKSKVTHILARRLAVAYRNAPYGKRPPLPILISFGKYRRGTSDFDGLVLRFLDAFGVANLTAEAFRYLISLGRVLFILDGYDEMVEANPDVAGENIADFVTRAGPRSRILLTTRSTFYRTSTDVVGQIADPLLSEDDVEVIDLQPFSKVQAKEYIARRLGTGPDRSRALERAQEVIDTEWNPDILGSPIFLSEFVNLIAAGGWSTTDVQKRGFLEYLIERTFARERARQNFDFTDQQQRRYLEKIAFDMLTTDTAGYERGLLEVFAQEAAPEEAQQQNWSTLWPGLASHYFLLPDDDEAVHAVATMRHQVWREYFQGCALASELSAGTTTAVTALSTRDLPEGVLGSAVGKVSPQAWAILTARIESSGDKLTRNLLRMALLRPGPEGVRQPVPPEIGRHLARRDLSDTVFRDVCVDASLAGANLTGCFFERCDLSRTSFDQAMLIRTDFRDCLLPENHFADANVSSLTIDGEAFFGPQIAAKAAEAGLADSTRNSGELDVRQWVTDVLWARLSKFTKARAGEPYAILDTSISWNAFMGGTDPKDRDFVVRRLYRALRAENVVSDAPTGMTSRPTVFLSTDQETRSEVLTFVRDGKVGPTLDRVVSRVVK